MDKINSHYHTIERAIIYLSDNYKKQPSLEVVSRHVGLSPFYFQRMFHEWAGVSPKKFLQYLSIEHAKTLLKQNHSLLNTSFAVGLSSTSRLHDLFVTTEGMTPGDFKTGAKDLTINYSFSETRFGHVIIASTEKGICYLAFCANESEGLSNLSALFPNARLTQGKDELQQHALALLKGDVSDLPQIKLHLKGTPFQLSVWQALLRLPSGSVGTYADIARTIDLPNASRAVGNAIGNNPIAYLIPCHRVIRSTGIIGHYRWGSGRKKAMLGWEAAHLKQ